MQVKKQQLEQDIEQQIGSNLGKEYVFFSLCAEYIIRNASLDEAQAGIKMQGEIPITSDMHMTPLLWQKLKRK